MSNSAIEWTDATWNPTTGCSKVSQGCKHCYAEIMSNRLQAMGLEKYKDAFKPRIHPETLSIPYKWKSSRMVFVNSMSDLFHERIPLSFIQEVFRVMNDNSNHVFQVLTKRSKRLLELNSELNWTSNIWMGVSVENSSVLGRVADLRKTSARIKFLSCEPLLGPLSELDPNGIDWVIVGGESGHKPRVMHPIWVESILDKCNNADVPFFFKQWGGRNKKRAGRLLNGRTYDEMPQHNLAAL